MRYNRVTTGKLTKPVNKLVKQLAVFLQGYVPDLYIRGTPLSSAFQDGSSPFLGHRNRYFFLGGGITPLDLPPLPPLCI